MSKSVFVLSRCMSCELLVPSKCVLFTCKDDFIVCFENLPSRKSSKVSTARRKILSPEEHKKKYFDHLVAILNDNEEKYGDTGHSCICKTAGMTHRKRCRSMVWSLKAWGTNPKGQQQQQQHRLYLHDYNYVGYLISGRVYIIKWRKTHRHQMTKTGHRINGTGLKRSPWPREILELNRYTPYSKWRQILL